jgi:hypothetical protein
VSYVTLTPEQAREFLSQKGVRRVGTHDFNKRRICHWPYCSRCGLVLLRNKSSRSAAAASCITYEDP